MIIQFKFYLTRQFCFTRNQKTCYYFCDKISNYRKFKFTPIKTTTRFPYKPYKALIDYTYYYKDNWMIIIKKTSYEVLSIYVGTNKKNEIIKYT